ncbi:MAG: PilZ protein [Alphaproteobacteria bacterium]|nr:PilZ protein [Alphaproteobacteria bacterium]
MHEIRSSILSGEVKSDPVARKGSGKGRDGGGLGGLTKIAVKRQEARVTNQRLEDRHRDIVEETTIVFRRKKQQARVVNVSSRGAMVEAEIEPRIGESLDIFFSGENRTRCAVRWVRDGRIGLEFVNETIFWESAPSGPVFHYESAGQEQGAPQEAEPVQREPRQRLLRSGTLYWSGVSVPVRLRNISSGGARVEGGRDLCQGAEVELDLGEAGFHVAEVRWSSDGQIGLRFASDFDLDTLAPAVLQSTGPASDLLKPAYLETELSPDSPWAARFERLSMTDLKILDHDG